MMFFFFFLHSETKHKLFFAQVQIQKQFQDNYNKFTGDHYGGMAQVVNQQVLNLEQHSKMNGKRLMQNPIAFAYDGERE